MNLHSHVQASKSRGHTAMLGIPVRHDKTLEAKLPLQNVVLQIRVLAPLELLILLYEHMIEPVPARTASAKGQR